MATEWGTSEERATLAKDLRKLVKGVWSSPNVGDIQKDWEKFIGKNKAIIESLRVVLKFIKTAGISEYEKVLLRLIFYLFVAEGGFANYMNFVCSMLVSQGHDLFNFFDRDFASSLDKIGDVSMYTKELFLNEHGFELFNKGLDRKLRNAIAHYDFKVEGDGTVMVDDVKTDVNKKLQEILSFVRFASDSIIPVTLECEKQFRLQQTEKT